MEKIINMESFRDSLWHIFYCEQFDWLEGNLIRGDKKLIIDNDWRIDKYEKQFVNFKRNLIEFIEKLSEKEKFEYLLDLYFDSGTFDISNKETDFFVYWFNEINVPEDRNEIAPGHVEIIDNDLYISNVTDGLIILIKEKYVPLMKKTYSRAAEYVRELWLGYRKGLLIDHDDLFSILTLEKKVIINLPESYELPMEKSKKIAQQANKSDKAGIRLTAFENDYQTGYFYYLIKHHKLVLPLADHNFCYAIEYLNGSSGINMENLYLKNHNKIEKSNDPEILKNGIHNLKFIKKILNKLIVTTNNEIKNYESRLKEINSD